MKVFKKNSNPRSVAVNHAGLWIRRHQFESGRGYPGENSDNFRSVFKNKIKLTFFKIIDVYTKTIIKEIADKPCLPLDKLKSSLQVVRDALVAPRAFIFVNTDYFRFIDSHLVPQNCSLQDTYLTVLFTAGDVVDLPFQRPVLDATDHIHNLKPAFGQRILCSDRECGSIHVS